LWSDLDIGTAKIMVVAPRSSPTGANRLAGLGGLPATV
jgi:hypothetical protein